MKINQLPYHLSADRADMKALHSLQRTEQGCDMVAMPSGEDLQETFENITVNSCEVLNKDSP